MTRVEADAYDFPHAGEMTAANTALMVIDMQTDFLGEGGWADVAGVDLPRMRAIIPPQQEILKAARRAGMMVIYTREGHRPGGGDITSVKRFRSRLGGAGVGDDGPLGKILTRGEPGWQIIPELVPNDGDPTIDKVGSGCFYGTGNRAPPAPQRHRKLDLCWGYDGVLRPHVAPRGERSRFRQRPRGGCLRRDDRGAPRCGRDDRAEPEYPLRDRHDGRQAPDGTGCASCPMNSPAHAPSVEVINLVKRFGGFAAVDGVSLRVTPGTVHALLGENGGG